MCVCVCLCVCGCACRGRVALTLTAGVGITPGSFFYWGAGGGAFVYRLNTGELPGTLPYGCGNTHLNRFTGVKDEHPERFRIATEAIAAQEASRPV